MTTNSGSVGREFAFALCPVSADLYVFFLNARGFGTVQLCANRFTPSGQRQFSGNGLTLHLMLPPVSDSLQAFAVPGGVLCAWRGARQPNGALAVRATALTDMGSALMSPIALDIGAPLENSINPSSTSAVVSPLGDLIVAWGHGAVLNPALDQGIEIQNIRLDSGIGPTAGALTRTAGTNVDSYTATVSPLGGPVHLSVDLTTTGHPFAVVLGFARPTNVSLGLGGAVALVDYTGNEILGFAPASGPTAIFSGVVPNDPVLCGQVIYTQAAHIGPGQPVVLSNAVDLYLGN